MANERICSPLPFQKGDRVRVINGTSGEVTAVGMMAGKVIVYRVGRNQYWGSWQLTHIRAVERRAGK